MLKDRIVLCAMCFAVGTLLWVKSEANSREKLAPSLGGMPSMQELYSNSDWDNLPNQEIREPY